MSDSESKDLQSKSHNIWTRKKVKDTKIVLLSPLVMRYII